MLMNGFMRIQNSVRQIEFSRNAIRYGSGLSSMDGAELFVPLPVPHICGGRF